MTSGKTITKEEKAFYPRTGKRGVPQQFPRKLYEMLELEAGSFSVDWIATGRGFSITNVDHFSDIVLPKWFKTSKYSSFQRNLNLYGFTKSRKGSTTQYFHPHFCKGDLEGLSKIRKRESPGKKKKRDQAQDSLHHSQVVETSKCNGGMKPYDTSKYCPLSPTSERLDILTEAMRLVIQGETRLYSASSDTIAIQRCFY